LLGLPMASMGQDVKVDFVTDRIVRVQWASDGNLRDNNTGCCVYQPQKVKVKTKKSNSQIMMYSPELMVIIDKKTQAIQFVDKRTGKTILAESHSKPHEWEPVVQERIIYDEKSAHVEETANGKVTVKDIISRDTVGRSIRYRVNFSNQNDNALYGLGCQMEDYMNLLGKTVYLTQHNLKVHVPMLLSTNGYGLMFDSGCAMRFESSLSPEKKYTMELEASKEIDYYFVKGDKLDDVVAGYRYLTGDVTMLPRYVFGYTQSKERYVSSDDIVSTLREYRRRQVPVDMIVQDWNYWPQGWGYMKMNPKYYPSPKALADSVHAMNAKLMISIWDNPQWCPEADDFKSKGLMLEHDVYDVFSEDGRKLFWKYADDEFFSAGFDAWWCDSSEPLDGDWNRIPEPENGVPYGWDMHEKRWHLNQDVLGEALGIERSSLYSLYHAKGIYENQRATGTGKRVVNLTRSSYLGQQRYSTIVWNGDTHASWQSYREQIPAGLNYMATGNPYWTVDAGSFFVRNDGRRWFYIGEFPDGVRDERYREYYTRMFQWVTFLPMQRSHGSDTPREIWQFGEPGTQYYDAIYRMIELRYQLVPYIYSMAYAQSFRNYTMARLLAFDFADDEAVLDIKDEYMFGDFLVCPVTRPVSESNTRKVYLPKGASFCDFWTNKVYQGGQWIDCESEISKLPLFVRGGSIITTTEVAQYTDAQVGKPVTVTVYPGADKTFTLYEDAGDGYEFEKGEYSLINLSWNDKARTLTIGKREGKFAGMQSTRKFIVKTNTGNAVELDYTGEKVSVRL